jgi:TP901 family phage tail tape measure protein
MARMSMETAIRLSAEVKGGGNITKVQRSLQDLAKGSKITARDMQTLRAATFQYARANTNTVAGIRNSITAFRGLQEQVKIGSREFKRYGTEIQKLEGKLRGIDGTAEKAGRSMGQNLAAGLAAAGIGRALRGITMQAATFEGELRKAAAIEGGEGSFGILKKEIEAVASVAAGTPTEVAMLATAMSRAGFTADQTAQSLRGIVLGAEATDIAFADMGGIVGTILKTFGKDASQTGAVVDSLVKSANSANQTVTDVGEAMSYAAGRASAMNVSVNDTLGLIALLADAGVKGSRAGTTIATGFTRMQIAAGGGDSEMQNLIRGSTKMIGAMDQLGASVLDAEGKLKPMNEVLINIKRQMQGFSPTDQAIFANAIFGADAGSGFLSLLQRTEPEINKMFKGVNNAGGVAEKTREKMRGFGDSVKILGGNLQNVTNQIGGAANVVFKPFVDFLNAALSASLGVADPIKAFGSAAAAAGIFVLGLAVAINAVNAGLLALGGATAIKAAITGMFSLKAAAATATGAITGLKAAMLAIPGVGWAAAAIVGTGLLGKAVYDTNETFRNFVDNIGGVLAADFRTAVNGMAADAKAAAGNIDKSYKDLAKGMEPVADFIRQLFKDAFKDTSNSAQVSAAQSTGAFNEFFTSLSTSATAGFTGLNTIISNWWNGLPEPIRNIFGGNAASMLAGAGQYVGGAIGRSTQGPIGPPVPERLSKPPAKAKPAPRVVPGNALDVRVGDTVGGGGGGGGKSGGGAKQSAEDRIVAKPFGREIIAAAKANSVDPALFAALVAQESGFDPNARGRRADGSFSGAFGLSQLMPGTAKDLGVNPRDPMQNLMGGAKYLRQQLDRFGLEGGLRAYNQGPGAQQRTPGGNSQESREYPGRVLARYEQFAGGSEGMAGLQAEGIKAQTDAAEKMQQQLKAAESTNVALKDRLALAQTTEPVARQMLEYDIKQNELARKYEQLKSAAGPDELILLDANLIIEQRIEQIEHEEKLNSLLAERAVLMANVAAQAAMPTVYNELETQEAALQAVLDKYPAIGAAADAASTLATSGVSEMIAGTKDAKEVFVDFLSSIADALMDTAKQMIAQYIAIGIARMFAGMGGSVATDAGGWATSFATPQAGIGTGFNFDAGAMTGGTPWSFAGGGYTGNAPRAGGVDGQGGFPAILHPRETVIDHTRAISRQGAATIASAPVNVTVNVDASGNSQVSGDQNQGAQLGRVIAGAVQQELVRQKRPGGLLAS